MRVKIARTIMFDELREKASEFPQPLREAVNDMLTAIEKVAKSLDDYGLWDDLGKDASGEPTDDPIADPLWRVPGVVVSIMYTQALFQMSKRQNIVLPGDFVVNNADYIRRDIEELTKRYEAFMDQFESPDDVEDEA